jgi:gamma-glutamylcyclotransferase (GGCT)/AIG2-like uncharacterized protein YtfP
LSQSFDLFVYGTLKRGGPAADVLSGCNWLGEATVRGTLYDIDGRFPALVLYGDTPVRGEVWRCPAELLLQLDHYEGVPAGLFRRVAREVHVGERVLPAWIYAAGPALSRRLVPQSRVPAGEWPPTSSE